MAQETLTIAIDPESELGQALVLIDSAALVLERSGERFRVTREADPLWAGYDPRLVRRALRQGAGALSGVDVAALKQEIREQRHQESHGRPG